MVKCNKPILTVLSEISMGKKFFIPLFVAMETLTMTVEWDYSTDILIYAICLLATSLCQQDA